MKKTCSMLLPVALLLSLAACGGTAAASEGGAADAPAGAAILDGLPINGDSVGGAAGDVAAWVDGLGL